MGTAVPDPVGNQFGRAFEEQAAQTIELASATLSGMSMAEPVAARERPRGALLVGGSSTRMGCPKALLEVRGTPLGRIAASALAPWVSSLAFVGSNSGSDFASWTAGLDVAAEALPDRPGVAGPLAGLLALFDLDPAAWWVVAACDLPRIDPAAVCWLLSQRHLAAAAILPEALGRVQPLFALYGPASRFLLEALSATDERSPRRLAGKPGVACPRVPAALESSWTNVNTPEEWRAFEKGIL